MRSGHEADQSYAYSAGVKDPSTRTALPLPWSSVSQNSLLADPLLASINNNGSSHPCSCKYRVSGWQVYKIKC
jgi:hypothetical protein